MIYRQIDGVIKYIPIPERPVCLENVHECNRQYWCIKNKTSL